MADVLFILVVHKIESGLVDSWTIAIIEVFVGLLIDDAICG